MTDTRRQSAVTVIVAATAIACASAGGRTEAVGNASRQVTLIEDPAAVVMPISLAAGSHLTSMPPGGRIGFRGVFLNGKEQMSESDAVTTANHFVRVLPGGTTFSCKAVVSSGRPSPSTKSTTPTNCSMPDMDVIYSLTQFVTTQDSAYVGATMFSLVSGSPVTKAVCITLVRQNSEWMPVRDKYVSHDYSCGR